MRQKQSLLEGTKQIYTQNRDVCVWTLVVYATKTRKTKIVTTAQEGENSRYNKNALYTTTATATTREQQQTKPKTKFAKKIKHILTHIYISINLPIVCVCVDGEAHATIPISMHDYFSVSIRHCHA